MAAISGRERIGRAGDHFVILCHLCGSLPVVLKIREPKREKRVNIMYFKWLWDDSVDVSRMLRFWSS